MIRHAKSSWANPMQSDFDRPLNERGEHDAPLMGALLKKKGLVPDLIISSPAKRAKQTAKSIAEVVGYEKNKIEFKDELYHCIPSVIEEVIINTNNNYKTVYIVCHNPGITDFINDLPGKVQIDNMPTCALAGIRVSAPNWSDFNMEEKEVFMFEYPKKYYDSK
jgi:phosphohistidine phosphatase